MDVAATSSVNMYNYQNNLKTSGQTSAVVQALGSAYSQMQASASSGASSVLTAAAEGPLVDAMVSLASGSGSQSNIGTALAGYSASGATGFGTTASLLLSAPTTDSTGFGSALTATTNLALTAYEATQQYGTGSAQSTATAAVQASNQANNSNTSTTTQPSASDATTLVQAAQAANFSNTLNLLA